MHQTTAHHAPVKFDSAAISRPAREFGLGILKALRGPTAEDVAFEMGRCAALDAEGPVAAPAGLTLAERLAFEEGAAEGLGEVWRAIEEAEILAAW